MAPVVVVHGIGQQFLGPGTMHAQVAGPLVDGVGFAGGGLTTDEVGVAFYGDWFRPAGGKGEADDALDEDVRDADPFEAELLAAWWRAAAELEPGAVPSPDAGGTKVAAPVFVQQALDALSHVRFFAGVADRFLLGAVRQVRRYLTEPETRLEVQTRIEKYITPDTRVVVAHSLGSVVAYEALCAHPEWPVRALVTVGSPLGIRNLIFDRLAPGPVDGKGCWPGEVEWTNVADRHDLVALVKNLQPLFPHPSEEPEAGVRDLAVNNGLRAHRIQRYLSAVEVGRAVSAGLADRA